MPKEPVGQRQRSRRHQQPRGQEEGAVGSRILRSRVNTQKEARVAGSDGGGSWSRVEDWQPQSVWLRQYVAVQKWMSTHKNTLPQAMDHSDRKSGKGRVGTVEHQLATWLQKQRSFGWAALEQEREGPDLVSRRALLECLNGWVWDTKMSSWLRLYQGLLSWLSAHGGVWPRYLSFLGQVPSMSDEELTEHRLARWVSNQRCRRGTELLERQDGPDGLKRYELLERIEGWVWDVKHTSWMARFEALKAWRSAHGGAWPRKLARITKSATQNEEKLKEHKLASWMLKQRCRGRDVLEQEREGDSGVSRCDLLESLEGWVWNVKLNTWLTHYETLRAWLSSHKGRWPRQVGRLGRLSNIRHGKFRSELQLGSWVSDQRSRGRDTLAREKEFHDGKIWRSRCELLEALDGWVWHARSSTWLEHYRHLSIWLSSHNGTYPRWQRQKGRVSRLPINMAPRRDVEFKLAEWVYSQRRRGRESLLHDHEASKCASRCELLERLPGWRWGPKDGFALAGGVDMEDSIQQNYGEKRIDYIHNDCNEWRGLGAGRRIGNVVSVFFEASAVNAHSGYYRGTVDGFDDKRGWGL